MTLLLSLLVSAALATPPPPPPADSADAVRRTELAFAQTVKDRDLEAFAQYVAEDAIFASDGVLRGREAIRNGWAPLFEEGAPLLEWAPKTVAVQDSGKLAISTGPYSMTRTAADGTVTRRCGTFMSIWQKQPDGSWKIIFDGGSPATDCP